MCPESFAGVYVAFHCFRRLREDRPCLGHAEHKDLWWESPASCARRMHSRARLRKVSGLIRIASGPGKDRRVLRQNSAAISASLGFSATLGRVAAERLSAALP